MRIRVFSASLILASAFVWVLAGNSASSEPPALAAVQAAASTAVPAPAPAKSPANASGAATGGSQQVPAASAPAAGAPTRYLQTRPPRQAVEYYGLVWGVGSLSVKLVESDEIARFSFKVLDADKAKTLNDKQLEPSLVDPQAGVKLSIPALEQVGILRQTSTPVEGKSYWMAFSNSGRLVKRGDRVNIVIGQFHADGIIVE